MTSSHAADASDRRLTLVAIAAGAAAAVAYTLSPLTVLAAIVIPSLVWMATRDLDPAERRFVQLLLAAAVIGRAAIVAALFFSADHDGQAAAILVPDEAYTLARTLRIRNVLLGIPALKYDYTVAFEDYGRTSFLWVVTAAQVVFGPSPYGMRLLDAALFLAGAIVLFRLARRAYGAAPAVIGLTLLVFLPTWIFWSVSLLKESLYLALSALALASVSAMISPDERRDDGLWRNAASWIGKRLALLLVVAVVAALLRDLRTGALLLLFAGLGLGVALYVVTASVRRFLAGAVLATAALAFAIARPAVQQRIMAGLDDAAREHIGHVFTVGHSYKTLDEGFYVPVSHEITLTPAEAARFAVRSIASFLVVPLPHQIRTRGELVQLPEHLLWYVLIGLAPFGIAAGLRRNRALTCLLIGYVIPTALVVALTNGNIGTLVRFRGLVTPYLVWLAALGCCVIMQRVAARRRLETLPLQALSEATR